jgi:hypothetical protein
MEDTKEIALLQKEDRLSLASLGFSFSPPTGTEFLVEISHH